MKSIEKNDPTVSFRSSTNSGQGQFIDQL
jgi:hypothetical protein